MSMRDESLMIHSSRFKGNDGYLGLGQLKSSGRKMEKAFPKGFSLFLLLMIQSSLSKGKDGHPRHGQSNLVEGKGKSLPPLVLLPVSGYKC